MKGNGKVKLVSQDVYTKGTQNISQKDTAIPVFTVALFTMAKAWEQRKCPLTDEWIKEIWYICMMECYSAMKRNKLGRL